jgi:hypothetical protein
MGDVLIGAVILFAIAAWCGSTAERRKTFKLGDTETTVTPITRKRTASGRISAHCSWSR